mmetsp:Transcript_37412/g.79839  ORF Transcript_37412/g.79839 Transcript_37412/m.79839 type:complete len:201 (-) Transcript_37412:440-1042(-)
MPRRRGSERRAPLENDRILCNSRGSPATRWTPNPLGGCPDTAFEGSSSDTSRPGTVPRCCHMSTTVWRSSPWTRRTPAGGTWRATTMGPRGRVSSSARVAGGQSPWWKSRGRTRRRATGSRRRACWRVGPSTPIVSRSWAVLMTTAVKTTMMISEIATSAGGSQTGGGSRPRCRQTTTSAAAQGGSLSTTYARWKTSWTI